MGRKEPGAFGTWPSPERGRDALAEKKKKRKLGVSFFIANVFSFILKKRKKVMGREQGVAGSNPVGLATALFFLFKRERKALAEKEREKASQKKVKGKAEKANIQKWLYD